MQAKASAQKSQARQALVVRAQAEPTRRNALAAGAAGLLLTLTGDTLTVQIALSFVPAWLILFWMCAGSAQAGKVDVPFHASLRGVGSTSGASQSGFDMEGKL